MHDCFIYLSRWCKYGFSFSRMFAGRCMAISKSVHVINIHFEIASFVFVNGSHYSGPQCSSHVSILRPVSSSDKLHRREITYN